MGIAVVLVALYVIFAPFIIAQKLSDNRKKQIYQIRNEITSIMQELNQARANEVCLQLIPSDYRYSLALRTMSRFIENGRADTWKECASLYEEQIHRWTLERNSAESLELQQFIATMSAQTARSAGQAAAFTGISAAADLFRLFI